MTTHSDRDGSERTRWRIEVETDGAPAGLPLHESADRDADNVPSETAQATCHGVGFDGRRWTAWQASHCPHRPSESRDNAPSVEEPWREYAEAMCQVAHFDGWMVPVAIPGNLDPRYRVAACFQCQKAARACVAVEERHTAELRAENERLRGGWRSVTSALGYGDGITEPQIGFAEFIRECEQRFSEADEWRESQSWRDECAMAGHPDDQDCFEHDPSLRLEKAEATIARVEALAEEMWAESGEIDFYTHHTERVVYRHLIGRFRSALRGPEPTEGGA